MWLCIKYIKVYCLQRKNFALLFVLSTWSLQKVIFLKESHHKHQAEWTGLDVGQWNQGYCKQYSFLARMRLRLGNDCPSSGQVTFTSKGQKEIYPIDWKCIMLRTTFSNFTPHPDVCIYMGKYFKIKRLTLTWLKRNGLVEEGDWFGMRSRGENSIKPM